MRTLYLLSVWLHILAATAWIGGMFFLVLVVVPWMRRGDRAAGGRLLRETGERFRAVGWSCFAVVLVTGSFNLSVRGVRLSSFLDDAWRASPFGRAVIAKLVVFACVLALSGVHDFWVGPQATRALEQNPSAPEAERLRRRASYMGRLTALLALLLVAIAVSLVRGPWW